MWARALAEHDPLACDLFATAIETIGVGVGSAINVLDVERVVVGGGLAEKLARPSPTGSPQPRNRGC